MDLPGSAVDSARKDGLETELKYVFPVMRTPTVVRLLESHCRPDPEFPYGVVSGIYYDSADWDFVGEKFNSDYLKTKVRVRWYEETGSIGPDGDRSFLELKRRIGSTRNKLRVPTPYTGAELAAMDLGDRRLLQLPLTLLGIGAQIGKPLFPAFIVRYERRRYIDRSSQARVAVDSAISSPKVNRQMIAAPTLCALEWSVLEVKGTAGEFPVALRDVFKLGLRREAFSKYMECYRRLTRTPF
jgi:hypothetical protein